MAFSEEKINQYRQIAAGMKIPGEVEAMGHVTGPDDREVITVSFAADRDLVKDLYIKINTDSQAFPSDKTETMEAIAGAVSDLAVGLPVVQLDLIGPKEIGGLLSDGSEPDDSEFYMMLLMTMALKNALVSYADYRKANKT